MVFEEFLEFVVRMSMVIYPDQGESKTSLAQKIDKFLIVLLGMVHCIKYPPYVPDDSDEEEEETI